MAARVASDTGPFWDSFAMAASAGEPGIIRGRKKFRVTAAHSVSTNRPNFCSAYFIGRPP